MDGADIKTVKNVRLVDKNLARVATIHLFRNREFCLRPDRRDVERLYNISAHSNMIEQVKTLRFEVGGWDIGTVNRLLITKLEKHYNKVSFSNITRTETDWKIINDQVDKTLEEYAKWHQGGSAAVQTSGSIVQSLITVPGLDIDRINISAMDCPWTSPHLLQLEILCDLRFGFKLGHSTVHKSTALECR